MCLHLVYVQSQTLASLDPDLVCGTHCGWLSPELGRRTASLDGIGTHNHGTQEGLKPANPLSVSQQSCAGRRETIWSLQPWTMPDHRR